MKLTKKDIKGFKYLFWNMDIDNFDPEKDKNIIIHQVLAYGSMDDIRKLLSIYGKSVVRKEFKKPKPGTYPPNILELVQRILGVRVNEKRYLKNMYEPLRKGAR